MGPKIWDLTWTDDKRLENKVGLVSKDFKLDLNFCPKTLDFKWTRNEWIGDLQKGTCGHFCMVVGAQCNRRTKLCSDPQGSRWTLQATTMDGDFVRIISAVLYSDLYILVILCFIDNLSLFNRAHWPSSLTKCRWGTLASY